MTGLASVAVFPDVHAVARAAAGRIVEALRRKPDLVMCVATGVSPLGVYEELGTIRRREPELFRALRIVKLDEWGGLAMDNPATCESYVRRRVLGPLGIDEERYIGFDSDPANPEQECARVAKALGLWAPIDVCVLGIGLNGHLGLNEPASALVAGCHVAELSETAKTHSMLTATGAEPRFGMTLGMGDLLRSKSILLLGLGPSKRDALGRMWTGGVTTDFPASFLALHSDVTVMTDIRMAPGECGDVEIRSRG